MAESKSKARGLGRGLSALMADVSETGPSTDQKSRRPDLLVPIEQVQPNPDQPRRRFATEALDDLSASIKEKGILQPLIVRPKGEGYEIVAGERRWRAAQMVNLHQVPVIIREFDDTEVLEVAIIENIQRADLNPVEEAAGYSQLMEKFGHTQEKLATALGKSRSHIANSMRLLQLPAIVQTYLETGKLSAGHARALITASDPASLAAEVIKKNLSVRATEKLVKAATDHSLSGRASTPKRSSEKDADTKALEGDLTANLKMKVSIDHKPGQEAGEIKIQYKDLDDLDTLCRLLSSRA